jgi:hypothetical protein
VQQKAPAYTEPPADAPAPAPIPPGLEPTAPLGTVQQVPATAPQGDAPHPPPAAAPTADEATRKQQVAVLAYLIAQERGFPPNAELEHWLEAERRLLGMG